MRTLSQCVCLLALIAFACHPAAAAEPANVGPAVTGRTTAEGVTEITITPSGGGTAAVCRVDLSKHFQPARERTQRVRRWESLRFGAFLCFNTNQFSGSEHCRITDPQRYNPPELDVAGWIGAFKKAQMRYAVLTTRHTSGFLLWDSATTDFDVGSSGNRTDVVRRFVDECRAQGLQPGLYYCMWGGKDWMPQANARAMIMAQLHELTTQYGPVPYFWIDMMNWAPQDVSAQEVYDALKSRQPEAVVILNQHIQDGRTIRYFPTDVLNGELTPPPAEGHNPIRVVGGTTYYLPFEFCNTSQGRGTVATVSQTPMGPGCWFTYGAGKSFAPSRPLNVQGLFDWIKAAYDRGAANVLLAVAPDHTGRMRPEDVEQLARLGEKLAAAGLLNPKQKP